MKNYLFFLYKLFKHKYYVLKIGLKLKVPIFQLIIHDCSKFLPCEHVFWYYRQIDSGIHCFDSGWVHHYHVNKHHWQYWVLREDSGQTRYLDIPEKYIREMVADWAAAGFSKSGKLDIKEWYNNRKELILISKNTRKIVEELIKENF